MIREVTPLALDVLLRILEAVLDALGPDRVRQHVDEWDAARVPSEIEFRRKFGEDL